MNWLNEAVRSVHASWRLFLHDPRGYGGFNETMEGFWRSFSALVVIAPIYLFATVLDPQEIAQDNETVTEMSLSLVLVSLALQWLAWPLLMAIIAAVLKLQRLYARYIIAYNWSSILVALVQLAPFLLFRLGLLGEYAAGLVSFMLLAWLLYFRWYIAVTALEVTGLIAAVLVLADLCSGVAIGRFFLSLGGI